MRPQRAAAGVPEMHIQLTLIIHKGVDRTCSLGRAGHVILQISFAQDPTATEADDLGMLLLQMPWLLSPCAILSSRSLAARVCFFCGFLKGGSVKRLFGGVRV